MKRLIVLAALVCAALFTIAPATAAKPSPLKCFGEAPATCTITQNGGAVLDTSAGGYTGVYLSSGNSASSSLAGTLVGEADFGFGYYCGTNTLDKSSCVAGGAPSYRIPISTDGNTKTTELYAVIDAANCGYTGTVSTTSANCPVFFLGGTGAGGATSYPNWDAMAAANPTWQIAKDLPFVIQDVSTPTAVTLYGVFASK